MDLHEREKKFLALIQLHKGIVYKIANAYCRGQEDRKDLVQEIFFQVWKSFEKYDPAFKHSTWIYRIALNVAISNYRKVKNRLITDPMPKEILTMDNQGDDAGTTEMIESLYTFISALKELDKALMLLYLEEKSQKEIAEILGLSETNVATKVGRVKKLLKEKFITQK